MPDLDSPPSKLLLPRDKPRLMALWFFKIAVAVMLLGWLWRSGHLDLRAWRALRLGPPLIGMVASQLTMIACQMLRWKLLMEARDLPLRGHDIVLGFAARAVCERVDALNLGLDGVRLWQATRRHPGRGGAVLGVLLLDRLAGLSALLVLVAVAPLWWREPRLMVLAALSVAALAALVAVGWWSRRHRQAQGGNPQESTGELRRIGPFASRLAAAWEWPAQRGGTLSLVALLSLAIHIANALSFAGALFALGHAPSLPAVAAIAPAVILSSVVPLTPLGLGVSDAVAQTLFLAAGLPDGANATMLLRATWLLISLVCGIAYFWNDSHSPQK